MGREQRRVEEGKKKRRKDIRRKGRMIREGKKERKQTKYSNEDGRN